MNRFTGYCVYLLGCAALAAWPGASARAHSAGTTVSVMEEGMVSTGGAVASSGSSLRMWTVLGDPAGGRLTGAAGTWTAGTVSPVVTPVLGSRLVRVEGAVDDPTARILVNGIAAIVTDKTFYADGVRLIEGLNTLAVIATDPAGNRATTQITVTLDTHPPAMPTLVSLPAVTTELTRTLTGTKTAETGVWVNGVQVVAVSNDTMWSVTLTLQEGDNVLVIITKDAADNVSAEVTKNIVVDNLPPVIDALRYDDATGLPLVIDPALQFPKTNFPHVTLAGRVDDSLTQVQVNGLQAAREGQEFQVIVPLTLGTNALVITATSPNGHITTQNPQVILGTVPTIVAIYPPEGRKPYVGALLPLKVTAEDQEQDPLSYQLSIDGQVTQDWSPVPTYGWTLTDEHRGLQTIEGRVRDVYGGDTAQPVRVYVIRTPIEPE